MRPNRRMPGTQRPAKQEPPMSDQRESPAFMRGEEVKSSGVQLVCMVALCPALPPGQALGSSARHRSWRPGACPSCSDTAPRPTPTLRASSRSGSFGSAHEWELDLEALIGYGVTPPARARAELSTRIVLAGDEPAPGQVIAHPELGAVTCVGVACREETGVGPPLLGVLVRSATEVEVERAQRDVDPDSPWLDLEFVEILLDQADQAAMQ